MHLSAIFISLSMATSAICKIKHEAHGRDANKAQGEAECFIGHRGSMPGYFD